MLNNQSHLFALKKQKISHTFCFGCFSRFRFINNVACLNCNKDRLFVIRTTDCVQNFYKKVVRLRVVDFGIDGLCRSPIRVITTSLSLTIPIYLYVHCTVINS